jgi:hypothetical protein
MTNQHHIVPSPEQVDQWFDDAVQLNSTPKYYIARQAALWGADQELEASLECLEQEGYLDARRSLRTTRRPKPSSLKEQAMAQLQTVEEVLNYYTSGCIVDTIRRALESLDD